MYVYNRTGDMVTLTVTLTITKTANNNDISTLYKMKDGYQNTDL